MKQRANENIRQRIRDSGLFYWQAAAAIGISEPQFTRWLRFEIPPDDERYQRIMTAIDKLREERTGGRNGTAKDGNANDHRDS